MSKLLVAGASGKLGKLVLEHLLDTLDTPATDIIAVTRTPEALSSFAERGVEIRKSGAADAASLSSAFKGAERVLLISSSSANRGADHKAAIEAAVAVGVHHLVYTSIPNPVYDNLMIIRDHAGTERAIADSALPGWTVLRNNWYFENLDWTIPQAVESGQWMSPNGDGKIAHISRSDLALAAAVALAKGDNGKSTYTLTGGKAYTDQDLVAAVSKAYGKPIALVPITIEQAKTGMAQSGLPDPMVNLMASSFVHTLNGGLANVTGDLEALTGKTPQTIEAWLAEKASAA